MKNILIACLILMGISQANASSVRQVTIEEMAAKAAVIFEGTVISVTTHKDDRGSIVTDVLFDVTDVIKGDAPNAHLQLVFLGGEFEGKTMLIADTHYPDAGEKGIYFVESINTPMVNPLYGWDQGRFIIQKDQAGVDRVFTAGKNPISSIGNKQSQIDASAKLNTNLMLSEGVASGVELKQSSSLQETLSKDEFKQDLLILIGEK